MSRKRKYTAMLNKAPTIIPKTLYISDNKGNLKKISNGDVKKEGISFDKLKEIERNKTKEIDQLKQTIKECRESLIDILKYGGYNTTNVDLKDLIQDFNNVTIFNQGTLYDVLDLDEDGYVIGGNKTHKDNLIIEYGAKPSGYSDGYYKYVDGEWIKDEQKYKEIWSVL